MNKIIITEEQLDKLRQSLSENNGKINRTKQQLYTIATLAKKMWEMMENNEEVEDWIENKISQCELGMVAVAKGYMYDEVEDELRGMEKLDYNELVIGT